MNYGVCDWASDAGPSDLASYSVGPGAKLQYQGWPEMTNPQRLLSLPLTSKGPYLRIRKALREKVNSLERERLLWGALAPARAVSFSGVQVGLPGIG